MLSSFKEYISSKFSAKYQQNKSHLQHLSNNLGQDDYRNHIWKRRNNREQVMNNYRKLNIALPNVDALAILNGQD